MSSFIKQTISVIVGNIFYDNYIPYNKKEREPTAELIKNLALHYFSKTDSERMVIEKRLKGDVEDFKSITLTAIPIAIISPLISNEINIGKYEFVMVFILYTFISRLIIYSIRGIKYGKLYLDVIEDINDRYIEEDRIEVKTVKSIKFNSKIKREE